MNDSEHIAAELTASQAAKLFHLDSHEIRSLRRILDRLLSDEDAVFTQFMSQLSMLDGASRLFRSRRRLKPTLRRWLTEAIRPWNAYDREPRLKHLALLLAKRHVPSTHIIAALNCLLDICSQRLCQTGDGDIAALHNDLKILRKRLASEQLGLLIAYTQHTADMHQQQVADLQQLIKTRSQRLRSTVALGQAINDEMDEGMVLRVLAQYVLDNIRPDFLAIHVLQKGDMVETPLIVVDGAVGIQPDDEAMQAIRKDWRLCRAARSGSTFCVTDVQKALVTCHRQEWKQDCGCYCCVPMTSGTQVLGWMHLRRHNPSAFSQEELEVLNIYGQMVGTAVTSLRLLAENRHQATTDSLTGLDNRRHFQTVMAKEDLLVRRRQGCATLMMIDVDQFKQFNDKHGHEIGDRVLMAIASALRGSVRITDEVARLGGDEFVVMLRDCRTADADFVARKILDRVENSSIRIENGVTEPLHVSIGVAGCPEHAKSLEETLLLADVALLRAKEAGRNQTAVYDNVHDAQVLASKGAGRGLSR